jgi:ABC-2 type transport system ATP-binding protein
MLPTSGDAVLAGASVRSNPAEVRRKIGVVFQAPSSDIKLTAEENLTHQGHLYGLSGAGLRKRVAEMLERVGLSDRRKELVETFSGGMQRRVELAKGLLHRPAVLLLDEPTTGLDPGARIDLWNYLKVLRDTEGVTVLVTTHLMEEAEKCDRLLILSEGQIVALGTPAELRSEIGGDVVVLESTDPASLAMRIEERFAAHAAVLGNKVRVEIASGHRFAAEVVEAFRGEVTSVSISKPTLEDVFIARTGHRFWGEGQPQEEER